MEDLVSGKCCFSGRCSATACLTSDTFLAAGGLDSEMTEVVDKPWKGYFAGGT